MSFYEILTLGVTNDEKTRQQIKKEQSVKFQNKKGSCHRERITR